jgi:hypothetical protein
MILEPAHPEHPPIYKNSAGIGSDAMLLISALARVLPRLQGVERGAYALKNVRNEILGS